MATHSRILGWKIPCKKKSMGSQRTGQNGMTHHAHTNTYRYSLFLQLGGVKMISLIQMI